MKIEILHIDDCPNWEEAGERVRAALNSAGLLDATIGYRLLRTTKEASEVPFAGSPTILLDGIDAFPSNGRTSDLACRIYRVETGFAGLPTLEQLTEIIRERS